MIVNSHQAAKEWGWGYPIILDIIPTIGGIWKKNREYSRHYRRAV